CSFAPPCNGPFSAPIADVTPEYTSDNVATHTRAVNVEAFNSWSACKTNALLIASISIYSPSRSFNIYKKYSAYVKSFLGATGSYSWRIRANSVTTLETFTGTRIALLRFASSSYNPNSETAVRKAAIG